MQNLKIIPLEVKLESKRIFVIGDIHACPLELSALLSHLRGDAKLSGDDGIIFIGDYINKGSQSKEVIDLLLELKKDFPQTIFLKGNHEDMLLGYLGFECSYGDIFLRNGGDKTLKSYGIKPKLPTEKTIELFPKDHLEFFLSLVNYVVSEEYVFVHAGLSPSDDLRSQSTRDIFWIRDEFIQNIHRYEKTVVFGHTPFNDIWFDLPYKIGIDTGLVYKNMLSCVELKEKSIFQVKIGSKEVSVRDW